MNPNRRSQERKVPERLVFCRPEGENGGSVVNLSEAGLCFESLDPIQAKELLRLQLCADLASPVEAIGKLAWIDAARRIGGLSFLGLSTPAREQIRNWLSESAEMERLRSGREAAVEASREERAAEPASAPEDGSGRQGEALEDTGGALPPKKAVVWQELREPGMPSDSMQLIPIERHRSESRWQFIRGVLVGIGISALVTVPIFRYAGSERQNSEAQTATRPAEKAQPDAGRATVASGPGAMKTLDVSAGGAPRRQQGSSDRADNPVRSVAAATATDRQTGREPSFEARPTVWVPTHAGVESAQVARKAAATPQQLWSGVQAGNMKAAVALADLYVRGEGVPVNCEQARVLLLVAAGKNNVEAPKKLQELDKGGCPASGH